MKDNCIAVLLHQVLLLKYIQGGLVRIKDQTRALRELPQERRASNEDIETRLRIHGSTYLLTA
ncbi:MAG: hypothetical protein CL861_07630 [Cyanobium sp. MED843]|nr:hypothetical protein [Cyanobium sp. MED843]